MIKSFILLLYPLYLLSGNLQCRNGDEASGECYKARLEVRGICKNYVIKLLEGNMDTALFLASWTDSSSGKILTNVFGLSSEALCNFPDDIEEGEEFYFRITTGGKANCAVCLAFRHTPYKRNNIAVLREPCKN